MEKYMSFDYYMIKNYDELNSFEQRQVIAEINSLVSFYNKYNELEPCDDPDFILEEARKHLYVINMSDEVVGKCANFSDTTWTNYDRNNCLGFVPFEQLGSNFGKG